MGQEGRKLVGKLGRAGGGMHASVAGSGEGEGGGGDWVEVAVEEEANVAQGAEDHEEVAMDEETKVTW